LKTDQIRATGRAAHKQELSRPLRPAMDLPRTGAPRGELTPETPATARTPLPAGDLLWPPAPGDLERLRAQHRLLFPTSGGEGCPTLPVRGTQRGTPAPLPSQKLARTHLPTHTPRRVREVAWPPEPQLEGSGPVAPVGRSPSCRKRPPRHGTDPVPALLSTDELRAAQGVFRNQNRMFPGCQPATQGYQA